MARPGIGSGTLFGTGSWRPDAANLRKPPRGLAQLWQPLARPPCLPAADPPKPGHGPIFFLAWALLSPTAAAIRGLPGTRPSSTSESPAISRIDSDHASLQTPGAQGPPGPRPRAGCACSLSPVMRDPQRSTPSPSEPQLAHQRLRIRAGLHIACGPSDIRQCAYIPASVRPIAWYSLTLPLWYSSKGSFTALMLSQCQALHMIRVLSLSGKGSEKNPFSDPKTAF
jgi:hypothetical protein